MIILSVNNFLQEQEGSSDLEAAQMDQQIQQAGLETMRLMCTVFTDIGIAIGMRKAEIDMLLSKNRELEMDIKKLKEEHQKELNTVVASCIAKREGLSDKMKGLIKKIERLQEECLRGSMTPVQHIKYRGFSWQGYSPIDMDNLKWVDKNLSLFKIGLDSLSNINYESWEMFKNYGEYIDYRTNKTLPQVGENTVSLSNALKVRQSNPVIRDLIQEPMDQYEVLEREIAPLRAAKNALIDKKEMMVDFHAKYLNELKQQENDFFLSRKLEMIRTMYGRMEWEASTTHSKEFKNNLKIVQVAFQDIISTLQGLTGSENNQT